MKPLCSCEEPEGAEPVRSRGRRNNGKGPKKPRQRGLGVEQLERLRIASGGVPIPTLHDHHHFLQCHPAPSMFGSVPVRYGAPAPPSPNYHHAHGGFHQYCPHHQQQQQVIGGTTGLNVLGGGGDHCSVTGGVAAGWVVPNQHNNRVGPYGSGPPTLFSPMENSKELSSMPNVHSDQSLDLCLKKTRFNEDNVSNAIWRERPSEAWPNVHDFIEFVNGDFYNKKLAKHIDAASASATPNPDEVVAVHRRGNSESSRVFMEYEFFPAGKDHGSRGTTSKELEFPTNMQGSVSVGGGSSEASSIITTVTASAYYGDTASNSVDLSLKL